MNAAIIEPCADGVGFQVLYDHGWLTGIAHFLTEDEARWFVHGLKRETLIVGDRPMRVSGGCGARPCDVDQSP